MKKSQIFYSPFEVFGKRERERGRGREREREREGGGEEQQIFVSNS